MTDKNMFRFVVIGHNITLGFDVVRARPDLDDFLRQGCSAIGAGEKENGHPNYDYYYEKRKTLQKKVARLKELGGKQVVMSGKNMFRFVVHENVIKMDYMIIRERPNLDKFLCNKVTGSSAAFSVTTYDYYYNNTKTLQKKVAFLKELGWKQVKKLK